MAGFIKGEVVVIAFPFSDFSRSKKRPALVITGLEGDDVILCQITSQAKKDGHSIPVTEKDFAIGKLRQDSHIRPNRLFTVDSQIILYRIGRLKLEKLSEVIEKIVNIIRN